jgi:hypothetical protein
MSQPAVEPWIASTKRDTRDNVTPPRVLISAASRATTAGVIWLG